MVEATSARLVPFVPPTPLTLPNGTVIDPATNLTTAMRLPQHANMSRAQVSYQHGSHNLHLTE